LVEAAPTSLTVRLLDLPDRAIGLIYAGVLMRDTAERS